MWDTGRHCSISQRVIQGQIHKGQHPRVYSQSIYSELLSLLRIEPWMHSVHFKKLPNRSPWKGNVCLFQQENHKKTTLYEGLTFRHLKGLHYSSSHGLKQLSSLCHAPKLLQAASNHRFIQHMYVMGHVTDWRIRQQNSPHCTSHSPPAQIHAISGQVLYQMKGRLSW